MIHQLVQFFNFQIRTGFLLNLRGNFYFFLKILKCKMVPIKITYQSHEIQFKDELDQKEKQLCNYYYIYSCNSNFSWYLKYIFN